MSDLITGDAVVVELRIAEFASRAVAFAIDVAVMVVFYLLMLWIAAASGVLSVDPALAATISIVALVTVFVIYPVTIETLTRGRSLGKMAMGLRVVREDGGPIRFRQALARGLAGFVVDFGIFSFFTGAIGLITSLISPRGRRVGDMLAGTVVVRERAPVQAAYDIMMPPPLAGWASTLELSQLPASLALSARQFLLRTSQLDPQVRAALGADLAGQVAAHVSPPPPPGTPPEPFLAAVLAARTQREHARLVRGQAPTPPPTSVPAYPTQVPQPPLPPTPPPAAPSPPTDGFALPR
ncbi:RDD family protein [Pseudonocardia sp. TRM90224]|uniref:RDD family protein n=1 Tax=Pseudonocardia sp. TRM90224 TaxID=2812678 RepID=UPI001E37FAE8|nr:RDD family protein [Pseudonocardia sp. TRM90224]